MACSKDCKKFGLAAVAAMAAFNAMEFVLHGLVLGGVYRKQHYETLWNPEPVMRQRMWVMLVSSAAVALVFTKVYTHGYEESKPALGQGLRYGFWAGLMVFAYHAMVSYAVYPISCKLAGAWLAGGVAEFMLLGALVSAIYRPAHEPRA